MWQQWTNVVLGLWIITSPFVGLSESAMTTNLVLGGVVIVALGWWGASEKKKV